MATIDLGKIKFNWRGTYAGGTAYVPDDVVYYVDGSVGSSYMCVANTTGNAPSSGGTLHASWEYLAKGQNASPTTTQGDLIVRGASADERLGLGSAGHALKVNASANGLEYGDVSAGLQSMNVYTTPGTATWTKPSGVKKVKVIVTGGGGGCSAVGGNRADDQGAGGAAGGTAIKIIDVSSISSVTVTVGMGGTATPANYNNDVSSSTSPNDGAPSSFGSHCSATGGKAGRSYYTNNAGVVGQAIPGVGSGGDINIQGGYGDLPRLNISGPPQGMNDGQGGVSFWGGPGRGAFDDNFTSGSNDISGGGSTGNSAGAFGSGGSAGVREFTGGAGTHGVVVVENYK